MTERSSHQSLLLLCSSLSEAATKIDADAALLVAALGQKQPRVCPQRQMPSANTKAGLAPRDATDPYSRNPGIGCLQSAGA